MKNFNFAPAFLFVFLLSLMVMACHKPSNDASSNCFNFDPSNDQPSLCYDMHGCLGYQSGMTQSGTTGNTFYDADFDEAFWEEVGLQREFFQGISANVAVLYEGAPELANCYAASDGRILIGYYFCAGVAGDYGMLPIPGALAHEYGHLIQYDGAWKYTSNRDQELEADAFSGLYMALYKQVDWAYFETYFQHVHDSGDELFDSPDHHGTPEQRLEAARFGVELALAIMEEGAALTYDDLHEIFMEEISNRIAPRSSTAAPKHYAAVHYPALTLDQRRTLFPHK